MKSLEKFSNIVLAFTICLFMVIYAFAGDSATGILSITAKAEEEVSDLTGSWKTKGRDGTWLEAYIDEETVSIYWVFEDGDERAVYWIGTYTPPEETTNEYSWVSDRDKEKTDEALFASNDDTKDFTYSDGIISIMLSSFGVTTTQYFYPEEGTNKPEEPPFEIDELSSDLTTEQQNAMQFVQDYVTPEFEELTLVDNDECTVIVTGIDEENVWGYTLDVYLENKSSDITYMFAVDSGTVNGLVDDPLFATEVAPGKICNDEISFSSVSNHGITHVSDISLDFRVYDTNDWSADSVVNETFHIYPLGEESAAKYEREPQDSDVVLIDTDDLTITITGFEQDDIWGYTANLFIENNADASVMVAVEDVSVNGYMLDPFWAKSVPSGCCAYSSMMWSNSDLEENGISEVSEIEMTLRAYDDENYTGEDLINETITINP